MIKANELGTEPIRKLLVKYALPGIIAMTASSLYNLVDSIFIGHGCGALALSGLTVAKPFMDICAAFGSLVGVGAGTLVSIKMGEHDYASANKILGNIIVLNILISCIITVVGLICLNPILYLFGASEDTLPYAHHYMKILLCGNVLTHIYFGLNHILRSTGHPRQSMFATIVAVLANIILDPIFIFKLDMGVKGAALATVISQGIAVIWQILIFCKPHNVPHFHKGIWHLQKDITIRALSIGSAPFLMNLAHCFVVIIINNQLKKYGGDMAIATYGIINRFTFVFAMIVTGLNQGMQPIVGYNFGAQQYKRIIEALRLTAISATFAMGIVFFLGEFAPEWVVRIFTHSEELIEMSIVPVRIISCSMLIIGFQMVAVNFFTSTGMSGRSIFLSLTRQVLYLIPLSITIPFLFDEKPILGVWWSIPISDILAAVTAMIMLIIEIRKFIRKTGGNVNEKPRQENVS